jgi:hypothetical protein
MYKLIKGEASILRLGDGAYIPFVTENRDYLAYLAWLAAGNTPQPADQPPLADVAHAKLAAINNGKNTALDGGFTHNSVLFDSDSKARLAYLEFAHKLSTSPLYSTPWKASTGQWVTMDAALFSALQPAYEQHIQACFAWQAAREMEVAAAVSAGSIEGVNAVAEVM